jgi:trans-aconitate 2-methyltransferase
MESPAMTWSAAQYVKFEQERTRPVHDLVARIPNAEVLSAADIGCGPGNSTEVLRERYPQARIVDLDSSTDMIEAATGGFPTSPSRSPTFANGVRKSLST